MQRIGLVAAALTLGTVFAGSAHAELLYIPASSAMIGTGPEQSCYVTTTGIYDWNIYADPNHIGTCAFEIPLNLPVGRTIKQITVFYGTDSQVANPNLSTYLAMKSVAAPYAASSQFDHWYNSYVPDGKVAAALLMAQSGKLFPDAFVVQANIFYRVGFLMVNGVSVSGVSVTYD